MNVYFQPIDLPLKLFKKGARANKMWAWSLQSVVAGAKVDAMVQADCEVHFNPEAQA